jgi:hypothetical protein
MLRARIVLWLLAVAAMPLAGCTFTGLRHATIDKAFVAFTAMNPIRGPMEAGATLIALIGLFVVIDDWLGGGKERPRDDSDEG